MKTEIKKLPKSKLEIEFELSVEEFKPYLTKSLEHLKAHVKVDGFRKGKVPEAIVKERVGTESLLMEAGDIAVRETYLNYVKQENLEPIGNPEIAITKIADGFPFSFKATITVLPEVKLPDYKAIAKTVKPTTNIAVTDEEVQDALNYVQKTRAFLTPKEDGAVAKDFITIKYQSKEMSGDQIIDDTFVLGEGGFVAGFEDQIIGMKAGDKKEFKLTFPADNPRKDLAGKEGNFSVEVMTVKKMELPEVNDEFAKQLGAFESLTALKDNMKEGMLLEKQESEKHRVRTEMLDKIAEKATFELPDAMVAYEKERLFDNFKASINARQGMSLEKYLATTKQTEEQLRETYQKEAEKRLSGFLVLKEIATQEKLEVTEKEVDEELERMLKNYTKEQISQIDKEQAKEYTKGVISNEKVFQVLEAAANS